MGQTWRPLLEFSRSPKMPGLGVIAETAKIFLSASDSAYFKKFVTKMLYLHFLVTNGIIAIFGNKNAVFANVSTVC